MKCAILVITVLCYFLVGVNSYERVKRPPSITRTSTRLQNSRRDDTDSRFRSQVDAGDFYAPYEQPGIRRRPYTLRTSTRLQNSPRWVERVERFRSLDEEDDSDALYGQPETRRLPYTRRSSPRVTDRFNRYRSLEEDDSEVLNDQPETRRQPYTRRSSPRFLESLRVDNGADESYRSPTDNSNNSSEKSNECDEVEDNIVSIRKSFQALFIIGDRDLKLIENDNDHREHCNNAEKHLANFDKHVKCIESKENKYVKMMSEGFREAVSNRCHSKTWFKKYKRFSKCYRNSETQEKLHSCSDKAFAAMSYSLKKVPLKEQLRSTCCIVPFINDCARNQTAKVCTEETANFLTDTVWEPFRDAFKYLCKGMFEEWCDGYPKAMKNYEEIFSRKATRHTEGFYRIYFKLIENMFKEK